MSPRPPGRGSRGRRHPFLSRARATGAPPRAPQSPRALLIAASCAWLSTRPPIGSCSRRGRRPLPAAARRSHRLLLRQPSAARAPGAHARPRTAWLPPTRAPRRARHLAQRDRRRHPHRHAARHLPRRAATPLATPPSAAPSRLTERCRRFADRSAQIQQVDRLPTLRATRQHNRPPHLVDRLIELDRNCRPLPHHPSHPDRARRHPPEEPRAAPARQPCVTPRQLRGEQHRAHTRRVIHRGRLVLIHPRHRRRRQPHTTARPGQHQHGGRRPPQPPNPPPTTPTGGAPTTAGAVPELDLSEQPPTTGASRAASSDHARRGSARSSPAPTAVAVPSLVPCKGTTMSPLSELSHLQT